MRNAGGRGLPRERPDSTIIRILDLDFRLARPEPSARRQDLGRGPSGGATKIPPSTDRRSRGENVRLCPITVVQLQRITVEINLVLRSDPELSFYRRIWVEEGEDELERGVGAGRHDTEARGPQRPRAPSPAVLAFSILDPRGHGVDVGIGDDPAQRSAAGGVGGRADTDGNRHIRVDFRHGCRRRQRKCHRDDQNFEEPFLHFVLPCCRCLSLRFMRQSPSEWISRNVPNLVDQGELKADPTSPSALPLL